MTRIRPSFASLAIFLALLLPLEQSHCAWMTMVSRVSRPAAAAKSPHACCRQAGKTAPAPLPTTDCCIKIPDGSLRTQLDAGPSSTNVSTVVTTQDDVALLSMSEEAPAPALDVGSPPPPLNLCAHGLRAPPRSA